VKAKNILLRLRNGMRREAGIGHGAEEMTKI